jgi:ELWxxDGT repeat protein/VCBS repeat-containing protein
MPDIAGNSLGTATPLNLSSTVQIFPDTVTPAANDYYRFNLSYRSSLSLSLTNLSADANVELLDAQGNLLNINNVPQRSSNPGTFAELINTAIEPGTYYIHVFPSSTTTTADYTLNVSARANLRPDILWRNDETGQTDVWEMNGTTLNQSDTIANIPDPNWRLEGTGDFNQDQQTDIVWRINSIGRVEIWLMNGNALNERITVANIPDTNWRIEGTGDFDQDGNVDILWRNNQTGRVDVWLMNRTTFVRSRNIANIPDTNWRIEGTGDFDQDGNVDILWRNNQTGRVDAWLMNRTLLKRSTTLAVIPDTNWRIHGTGDFNRDGNLDILWRRYSGPARTDVWFMNQTTFQRSVQLSPQVTDANWQPIAPFTRVEAPLPIDAVGDDPNRAFNLGNNLGGTVTYQGLVGSDDPEDYYQFSLNNRSNLSLSLANLTSDLNLELRSSTGQILQRSTLGGTSAESISSTLDVGTYYVRVFPANGSNSTYSLTVGVNNFPVLVTNAVLSLNEGATANLTSSVLRTTDVDNPASQLTYTLGTLPAQGSLILNSTTLTTGGTFTQAILDTPAGILYQHNSSETTTDSFTFTVSDGNGGLEPRTFSIAITPVNDNPVLVTGPGLAVTEGAAANLTSSLLRVSDPDNTPNQLVYTLNSLPTHGNFSVNGTTLTIGSTFTQATLDAQPGLLYSHNGSESLTDSFSFTVSDGAGGVLSNATYTIAVTPANDGPILTVPVETRFADQGANSTIFGISVTDVDAADQLLTVTLTATNGVLSLGSSQGLTFAQGDGQEDGTIVVSGALVAVNAALRSLVYRSNATFQGTDTVTLTVNDNGNVGVGGAKSDSKTISVVVSPVNRAPVISLPATAPIATEDRSLTISNLRIDDPDAGGGEVTVSLAAVNGVLSLPPNSGVTLITGSGIQDRTMVFRAPLSVVNTALEFLLYQGDKDFSGTESITIRVSDNGNTGNGVALSDTKTLTFAVNAANDRPVINIPDAQTAIENTDLRIVGIRITDADAGSGELSVNLSVANGTLTLASVTGLTFSSGGNQTSAMVFRGTETAINAALNGLIYRSPNNFTGAATIAIEVNDNGNTGSGVALSDSQTINITVLGANSPPVIGLPANLSTNAGQDLPIAGITITDPDAGTNNLTVTIAAANGVLSFQQLNQISGIEFLQGNGTPTSRLTFRGTLSALNGALARLVYRANSNFQGFEGITIGVSDQVSADNVGVPLSDTKTLFVNVGGAVNQLPIVVNNTYSIARNGLLSIARPGVLADDSDPEGFPLNAALGTGVNNGSLTFNRDGSFTYSPTAGFVGTDSFTYRANDGISDSDLATVLITVTNAAPTATNDLTGYSTNRNAPLTVPVTSSILANDSDPNRDPLTVAAGPLTTSNGGTLSLNANGSFTYTPALNFAGVDSFTYQASDGLLTSNTATVNLTVNPGANLPPTIVTTADSLSFTENQPVPIDPAITVTDIDSSTLVGATVAITSGFAAGQDLLNFTNTSGITGAYNAATGTLILSGNATLAQYQDALRSVIYDNSSNNPNPAARTVTFTANDGSAIGTATRSITITTVNDPPAAVNDLTGFSTSRGQALNVPASGVLANDTDPENDPLTAIAGSFTGTGGTLSLNADGSFTYTPTATFIGVDTFTYQAQDASLLSNTATILVTVSAGVNVAPVVTTSSGSLSYEENQAATPIDPALTVSDVDTPNLTGATVALTGGFTAGQDSLSVTNTGSITGNFNTTTGILTLTGTASQADYQAALRSVSYSNSSENPSTTARTIAFTVNDGNSVNNLGTATRSITVTAVNDAPVAANDLAGFVTSLGQPLTVPANGVLANDTDPENDPLTAIAGTFTGSGGGTLSLNADGSFTYTPTATFTGVDTFTYQAQDASLPSNTATIQVTVTPQSNTPPTVVDDTNYSTQRNAPLTVPIAQGVLQNDSDAEQNSLTAIAVTTTGTGGGSLNLNPDGTFTYTPANNFVGNDSFTYRASDGIVTSTRLGTIVISVTAGTNAAPTASDNSYEVIVGTPLTIDFSTGVLVGDSDPDGDSLTVIRTSAPGNGTVSLNADGSFIYTPNANFTTGIDSFTYVANDGLLSSNTATVFLTVTQNAPPLAADDTYRVPPNRPFSTTDVDNGVLQNDADPNPNTQLTAIALTTTGTGGGTLSLNANGTFTYTPVANFTGSDSFTYQVSDGAAVSNTATIVFNVQTNTAPVANNDSYRVINAAPFSVNAPGVLEGDTDTDPGTTLTVSAGTGNQVSANGGTLSLNADGSFTYTPQSTFVGTDSFTYAASDGIDRSNTATIFFTVTTNAAPTVQNETYTFTAGQSRTIDAPGVLTNDSDPDGNNTLSAFLQTPATRGIVNLNADGSFTYIPDSGFTGVDSFVYRVNDGFVNALGTATLSVGANTRPIANADTYSVNRGGTLSVTLPENGLLQNDTDVENSPLTVVLPSGPLTTSNNGTVTLTANGTFVYTPQATFTGIDSFTYTVSDGTLISDPATVTLSVRSASSPPIAGTDTYTNVPANNTFTVSAASGVLQNDSDPEADPLTVSADVRTSTNGTLSLNSDGSFTYTPIANFRGTDSFTYAVSDGLNATTGTISLSVGATNGAPVVAIPGAQTVLQNTNLFISGIQVSDVDAGSNPIQVTLSATNGNLSLSTTTGLAVTGDGSSAVTLTGAIAAINAGLTNLRYTTTQPFFEGTDTLTVVANDQGNTGGTNNPLSDTETITITVTTGATQLLDINPGAQGSAPANLTAAGNTLYFTANNGSSGTELWRSDGTAGGTALVTDLNVTPDSRSSASPSNLTVVNNTLFFSATNGLNGIELWSLDLTQPDATPTLVRDIRSGGDSSPANLVNFNGTLYFRANDGTGLGLWRSDGTAAGTTRVAGITQPGNLTVVGNNLFFRAGTGGELWRTDGPTPTRIIDLGATAQILNLTAVGNTLFFTAIDGNGRELWLSDGTAAGTRRISDINPNAASSDPNNLVNLNGTLYFFARNATSSGLYRSTPTGTVTLVQDLPSNLQPPNSLTVVGSRLFFVVNAGTGSTLDRELWQSDGTTPSRVIDINPTGDANPASLTNVNGTLYFTANDGTGVKLWRSDGSVAGTTAIGTAFTGAPPTNLTAVGNRLYFAASSTGNGEELWIL